jgi:hypothetical protein
MSISDDDINSQPADDGLPPVVTGEDNPTNDGDSDATDGGEADATDS